MKDAIPIPEDVWRFLVQRARSNGIVRVRDLLWALRQSDRTEHPDGLQWSERVLMNRITALENAIRAYLSEYDTPATDHAYRAQRREQLRKLLEA